MRETDANGKLISKRRDVQRTYLINTTQILKDNDYKNKDVALQCEHRKDAICASKNRIATLKKRKREYIPASKELHNYVARSRSYTEVGVGSVRTLMKKRVQKVYLPERIDTGCGSSDINSIFVGKVKYHNPRSFYESKSVSSKCVGGVMENDECGVLSVKLSPIIKIVSEATSPKQSLTRNVQVGSNIITRSLINVTTQIEERRDEQTEVHSCQLEKKQNRRKGTEYKNQTNCTSIPKHDMQDDTIVVLDRKQPQRVSTESVLQFVHNLEYASEDPKNPYRSSENTDQLYENEVKSVFIHSKSKDVTIDKPKKNKQAASIRSGSPIEHKSSSDERSYSVRTSDMLNCLPTYHSSKYQTGDKLSKADVNDKKPVFKIWSKRFEDIVQATLKPSFKKTQEKKDALPTQSKTERVEEKEKRNFFFFKKKHKDKEKEKTMKNKKSITTEFCAIKDGLKMQKFRSHSKDSCNKLKVVWNNNVFNSRSSMAFELKTNSLKDTQTIFGSKSMKNVHSSYFQQYCSKQQDLSFVRDIEAWMIPNATVNYANIYTTTKKRKCNNENMEVRISDQKWIIDKSKAFSHKIEVILFAKNIVEHNSKDSCLRIDIPSGFFPDSSDTSVEYNNKRQEQSSDELVYNVVEYETGSDNVEGEKSSNKREQMLDNIEVTVSFKSKNEEQSKLFETMIKTPTVHRDVIIQGSAVCIPAIRDDIVGVSIVAENDIFTKDKWIPILKNEDCFSGDDSELEQPYQKTCEFGESFLQEYYRNGAGLDLWYINDCHLLCCSETSKASVNNPGNITKSCPNILDDVLVAASYMTSKMNCNLKLSRTSTCSKLKNSINCVSSLCNCAKPTSYSHTKKDQKVGRRVLPKDSIEVYKRRKIYAMSMKSQWKCSDCDAPAVSVASTHSRATSPKCWSMKDYKDSIGPEYMKPMGNELERKHICLLEKNQGRNISNKMESNGKTSGSRSLHDVSTSFPSIDVCFNHHDFMSPTIIENLAHNATTSPVVNSDICLPRACPDFSDYALCKSSSDSNTSRTQKQSKQLSKHGKCYHSQHYGHVEVQLSPAQEWPTSTPCPMCGTLNRPDYKETFNASLTKEVSRETSSPKNMRRKRYLDKTSSCRPQKNYPKKNNHKNYSEYSETPPLGFRTYIECPATPPSLMKLRSFTDYPPTPPLPVIFTSNSQCSATPPLSSKYQYYPYCPSTPPSPIDSKCTLSPNRSATIPFLGSSQDETTPTSLLDKTTQSCILSNGSMNLNASFSPHDCFAPPIRYRRPQQKTQGNPSSSRKSSKPQKCSPSPKSQHVPLYYKSRKCYSKRFCSPKRASSNKAVVIDKSCKLDKCFSPSQNCPHVPQCMPCPIIPIPRNYTTCVDKGKPCATSQNCFSPIQSKTRLRKSPLRMNPRYITRKSIIPPDCSPCIRCNSPILQPNIPLSMYRYPRPLLDCPDIKPCHCPQHSCQPLSRVAKQVPYRSRPKPARCPQPPFVVRPTSPMLQRYNSSSRNQYSSSAVPRKMPRILPYNIKSSPQTQKPQLSPRHTSQVSKRSRDCSSPSLHKPQSYTPNSKDHIKKRPETPQRPQRQNFPELPQRPQRPKTPDVSKHQQQKPLEVPQRPQRPKTPDMSKYQQQKPLEVSQRPQHPKTPDMSKYQQQKPLEVPQRLQHPKSADLSKYQPKKPPEPTQRPQHTKSPDFSKCTPHLKSPDKSNYPLCKNCIEPPQRPQGPKSPEFPQRPQGLKSPELSQRRQGSKSPQLPQRPQRPKSPEFPQRPQRPKSPELPQRPQGLKSPELPQRSQGTKSSELAQRPQFPKSADLPKCPQPQKHTELAKRPQLSRSPETSKFLLSPKSSLKSVEIPLRPQGPKSVELPQRPQGPKSPELPQRPQGPKSVELPRRPQLPKSPELPPGPQRTKSSELAQGPQFPKSADLSKCSQPQKPTELAKRPQRSKSPELRPNSSDYLKSPELSKGLQPPNIPNIPKLPGQKCPNPEKCPSKHCPQYEHCHSTSKRSYEQISSICYVQRGSYLMSKSTSQIKQECSKTKCPTHQNNTKLSRDSLKPCTKVEAPKSLSSIIDSISKNCTSPIRQRTSYPDNISSSQNVSNTSLPYSISRKYSKSLNLKNNQKCSSGCLVSPHNDSRFPTQYSPKGDREERREKKQKPNNCFNSQSPISQYCSSSSQDCIKYEIGFHSPPCYYSIQCKQTKSTSPSQTCIHSPPCYPALGFTLQKRVSPPCLKSALQKQNSSKSKTCSQKYISPLEKNPHSSSINNKPTMPTPPFNICNPIPQSLSQPSLNTFGDSQTQVNTMTCSYDPAVQTVISKHENVQISNENHNITLPNIRQETSHLTVEPIPTVQFTPSASLKAFFPANYHHANALKSKDKKRHRNNQCCTQKHPTQATECKSPIKSSMNNPFVVGQHNTDDRNCTKSLTSSERRPLMSRHCCTKEVVSPWALKVNNSRGSNMSVYYSHSTERTEQKQQYDKNYNTYAELHCQGISKNICPNINKTCSNESQVTEPYLLASHSRQTSKENNATHTGIHLKISPLTKQLLVSSRHDKMPENLQQNGNEPIDVTKDVAVMKEELGIKVKNVNGHTLYERKIFELAPNIPASNMGIGDVFKNSEFQRVDTPVSAQSTSDKDLNMDKIITNSDELEIHFIIKVVQEDKAGDHKISSDVLFTEKTPQNNLALRDNDKEDLNIYITIKHCKAQGKAKHKKANSFVSELSNRNLSKINSNFYEEIETDNDNKISSELRATIDLTSSLEDFKRVEKNAVCPSGGTIHTAKSVELVSSYKASQLHDKECHIMKSKSRMTKLHEMLKVVLTSNINKSGKAKVQTIASNEFDQHVTFASLNPNYFRHCHGIYSNSNFENKLTLSDTQINRKIIANNDVSDDTEAENSVLLQCCSIVNGSNQKIEKIKVETQKCSHLINKATRPNTDKLKFPVDFLEIVEPGIHQKHENKQRQHTGKLRKVRVDQMRQHHHIDNKNDSHVTNYANTLCQDEEVDNNTNNEVKKIEKKNMRIEMSNILQSYETKKAVLEIYAEKNVSGDGKQMVAKMPKFDFDSENEIYNAIANLYVCQNNIIMINR